MLMEDSIHLNFDPHFGLLEMEEVLGSCGVGVK